MTSTEYRRRRGLQTQNLVAEWFRGLGWPHAESAGSGRKGVDVLGLPGLACEVKARRELRLVAWLRQARTTPGVSFVVHRPDGMGPQAIAEWPVTMRLADFTQLLIAAGYGGGGDVPAGDRPAAPAGAATAP